MKKYSCKKKKRSRGDQFEVVMNSVMKELVSAQEQNEERYLDLEQKRMKMEEKIFEKEIEMQRESRQFQLQMIQMMTSLVHSHSSSSFPPPWQHQLNIPTSKDQCICLMMMILHRSNKCKLNYMKCDLCEDFYSTYVCAYPVYTIFLIHD